MKHVEDKIVLIGLIAGMLPFTYQNGEIRSNVLLYIDKTDLINTKKELELLLENNLITDEEKNELNEEIYFINRLIENLGL